MSTDSGASLPLLPCTSKHSKISKVYPAINIKIAGDIETCFKPMTALQGDIIISQLAIIAEVKDILAGVILV
jgi:hypothetical protein